MDATTPEYLLFRWQEWNQDNPAAAAAWKADLYDQLEWEARNRRNLNYAGIEPDTDLLRRTLGMPPHPRLPQPIPQLTRPQTTLPPPPPPRWKHWSPEPLQEPTDQQTAEHTQRIDNIPAGGIYHRGPLCRNCLTWCHHYDDIHRFPPPPRTEQSATTERPLIEQAPQEYEHYRHRPAPAPAAEIWNPR